MDMNRSKYGPLDVSALQLGAMMFGTVIAEPVASRLLDQFLDAGGNFIDTSNNYAFWANKSVGGESELLLGRWLKDRGRRDDVVIASKCGAKPNQPGAGLEDIEGLSRDVIIAQVDESLARLGTDYLDLYYAHVDDRTIDLAETLAGFDELVRAGKVRTIACSNYTAWRIAEAQSIAGSAGHTPYSGAQMRYSYFLRRIGSEVGHRDEMGQRGGFGIEEGLGIEHLDFARANPDFRLVAYSPLLGGGYAVPGRFTGGLYDTPDNMKRRAALDAVVAETGATANQIVLAWLMQSSPAIIPLFSASSEEQLSENLGATQMVLSEDQMQRLNSAV